MLFSPVGVGFVDGVDVWRFILEVEVDIINIKPILKIDNVVEEFEGVQAIWSGCPESSANSGLMPLYIQLQYSVG